MIIFRIYKLFKSGPVFSAQYFRIMEKAHSPSAEVVVVVGVLVVVVLYGVVVVVVDVLVVVVLLRAVVSVKTKM